jgi:hypothetical protein
MRAYLHPAPHVALQGDHSDHSTRLTSSSLRGKATYSNLLGASENEEDKKKKKENEIE